MTSGSRTAGRQARSVGLVVALVTALLWPLLPAAGAGPGDGVARVAVQPTTDQATLETVQPLVEWQAADQTAWAALPAGETAALRVRDQVRTGAGAAARLVYFEGTVSDVAANTSLVVQRLERSPGGSIVGSLFQSVGTTVSRIVRLADPAAAFEVETPAATALVRGTILRVDVATSGVTRVANEPDETGGRVEVTAKDAARAQVVLQPGEETTVVPGGPPTPPRPIGQAAPPPGSESAYLLNKSG